MTLIAPPALNSGDTIGIMAPSGYVTEDQIAPAVDLLKTRGYEVYIHPQTYARDHQSAGTTKEKISALHDLFKNTDIRAVFAAGGGNRALHILDHLDDGLIRANPKILMGYSDTTALLNTICSRAQLMTFHGPVVKQFTDGSLDNALALLTGKTEEINLEGSEILRSGIAEGTLIGGNLSLVQYLLNDLPPEKPYILMLEDIGEELSHLDRTLCHLKRSGLFGNCAALIFGEFLDLKDTGRPYGLTFEDIVREHTNELDIPVLINAPFGHGKRQTALPIGCRARLEGHHLKLLETPVKPVSYS